MSNKVRSEQDNALSKSITKVFLTFMLLVIPFIICFNLLMPDPRLDSEIKKSKLNGIVVSKFLDNNFRNNQTIILNDLSNERIYFYENEKSKFYNYIQIGDSIYKPYNSLEIKVYRNDLDTTFKICYP